MTTDMARASSDHQRMNRRRAPVFTVARHAAQPIHRSAGCACGGGCPRCESASAQLAPEAATLVDAAAASAGSPLPHDVQHRFGSRLGADLGAVRVHTGAASQQAADALAARAYTIGSDIHFAAAQYEPRTIEGERLLAHEVVHTVQQSGTRATHDALGVTDPADASEREADSIAERITDRALSPERNSVSAGGNREIARDDTWSPAYGTRKTHTGLTIEQYQKAMGTGDFSKGQGVELLKAASEYGAPKRKTMTITPEQLYVIFPDLKKDADADETAAEGEKRDVKKKVETYAANLTEAFKVMKIDTIVAQATYLAHAFVESDQFRIMSETVRSTDRYKDDPKQAKLDESYLTQKYMKPTDKQLKENPNAKNEYATTVNPQMAAGKTSGWDESFIGRGPLQVTHRAVYVQVIAFLDKRAQQADAEKDADTADKARAAMKALEEDPRNAADPKYAFLISAAFMQMAGGVRRSAKLQGQTPGFEGLGPESVWMTGHHLESTDVINKPKLKADAFKRAVDEFTKADAAAPAEEQKSKADAAPPAQ